MSEFEIEREHTRAEAAEYLHKLADGLHNNESVTFISGEESATINPPQNVHFRMETNQDSSWIGGDRGRSIVVELGWEAEDVEPNEDLIIVNQPRRSGHRVDTDRSGTEHSGVDDTDHSGTEHSGNEPDRR